MSTKVDYTPLSGGLDLISGALNVKPGRLSECLNFEQVFGKQGYRRIDGYERFDGQQQPHLTTYSIQRFKAGLSAITVGQTITGAAASGKVLQVTLESGAWGAGAAGVLVILITSGAFANDEPIKVGAATVATADGTTQAASLGTLDNASFTALAQAAQRSMIAGVPGSGPVLGVAVYLGDVYAARNNVAGTSATLYRSSPTGWTAVRAGLLPGGRYSFDVANFSGSSKTMSLFGCDGKNPPFKWDGTTFTQFAPIYGSQGTSVTSQAMGLGAKTFAIVQPVRSWLPSDKLTITSRANGANRMDATVTTYSASSLEVNVTAIYGSGTFTDWDMGAADFADKPYLVTAHKDHLFLAYPLGQLQTSNIGDPLTYTSTAALFGLGDSITGMTSMKGAVLGVFCSNKINILSGSSSLNWQMELYSRSAGARLGTVLESGGNALFLDDRGLTSLQSTQSFGDFAPAIFSRDVKPLMDAATPLVTGARMAKSKFQYRLYAGDSVIVSTILSPNAEVAPTDVAFFRWQYSHTVTCTGQGDMKDGLEGMFFGTADGYVMREDVGTSFDGEVVRSVIRLHFNHLKSPSNKKRFRKLELELDSPGMVRINFRQQFDYSDGKYAASLTQGAVSQGAGGQWDVSSWDAFAWSLPIVTQAEANIDGVGKNMGLLLWHESAKDLPFTLQGLLLQYSILGMAR